uniref:Protein RFT1 homolog n=1 Tax=Strombidium inclinatum TaxID=197538 RepID=A0A7S3MY64_9SPIT|mmetsp:Transcript_27701/g.41993  ORF Transcript_27701/g.41993 Transcript_27701/m.41993 type:complete len:140 (+) Transcript_27701:701-1120(+)
MSEAFAYGMSNKATLNKLQGMLVFNSVLYVTAVVTLSGKFGIIGLVYANCVNMGVRGVMSLVISVKAQNEMITDQNKKISLLAIVLRVLSHKFFAGILVLGAGAVFLTNLGLDFALQKTMRKRASSRGRPTTSWLSKSS